jgi:hypothetical protein
MLPTSAQFCDENKLLKQVAGTQDQANAKSANYVAGVAAVDKSPVHRFRQQLLSSQQDRSC